MTDKPVAKKIAHLSTFHNNERVDNYHWLRDASWPKVENPEILDYLNQENAYCKSIMAPFKKNEDAIYQELVGRIKLEDSSVPVQKDNYFYYSRTTTDSNYQIFCRKKGSLDNPEEIILDVNQLAKDKTYFNLGAIAVSPDHSKLIYSIDESGGERYVALTKILFDGSLYDEKISDAYGGIVWHENGQSFFYAKLSLHWRCEQIFYHQLGTPQSSDKLIFTESDSLFQVGVSKTSSKQFIIIDASSMDSNEVWFISMQDLAMQPKLIVERSEKHQYHVSHHDEHFYILTNDKGKNFRLIKTPIANPEPKNWQEVITHDAKVYFTDFAPYKDFFAVTTKVDGLPRISIFDYQKLLPHVIKFPDAAYQAAIIPTTYDAATVRYSYSSLNTPESIMEFDIVSHKTAVLKETEILGGYDKNSYRTERIMATSKDGTQVPISLVYKKELFHQDGNNPVYLYGYGSYGIAIPPSFKAHIISLLDRGFIYAIAHIRGGDELGYDWYESAKFLTKKRTFEDYISCAEHLIAAHYTKLGNIAMVGRSAGGLLVGAVVNEKPELFKAVAAEVPFVDVLNTMLDDSLPLTPGEFKEWGNPKNKEYYDYIKSYSPYDNVKRQDYPAMYITAGISDPRVTYWEPAKWVAKLRKFKTDDNLLLFELNMDAGHAGASGRFGYLRDMAKEFNFIFKVCGIGV